MRRIRGSLAVALGALALFVCAPVMAHALTSEAPTVTSGELVESPKEFDGTEVTFVGEAVGESMRRGEMAWLHLNDDAYMERNVEEGASLGGYNSGHAVWVDASDAAKVTYFGDYDHEGDIVRVTGTFNAACLEHGGDMDIHAETLVIVREGHDVADPIHSAKVWWAIALSALAAVLYASHRRIPH